MPFGDNSSKEPTLAKALTEESHLKLDGNLPRLDGATSLYPLYSAFVRAVYPEGEYYPYSDLRKNDSGDETIAVCSRTSSAFENLIDGYADVIFLMGVSEEQRTLAESMGLELILTPIGREAFVFFVNRRNGATNLSTGDIKGIYSGNITNWSELGGKNNAIRAYQRPDDSGSQTALKQLMGDVRIVSPEEINVVMTMFGMYTEIIAYKNYKNALGYSFLFFINDMISENKVKFLSIDGVAPIRENIATGAYPLADDFYAVTVLRDGQYVNAGRTENIDSFIDWILSEQGQYLVDVTGYVPIIG
jgi:phosphate transport system substrate-binding protein